MGMAQRLVSSDLIDAFLPDYDVRSRHSILIHSNAERVYECLKTADVNESALIRTLFAIRGIGSRALFKRPERRPITLETLTQNDFVLLGERPADEIVLGLIGRPWAPRYEVHHIEASEFVAFAEPGLAKIAWSFKVDGDAEGVRLSTQTRVKCLDRASLARFRLYWAFTEPFSGIVRMELLRLVRGCAQSAG
jgi:hypothetical protein